LLNSLQIKPSREHVRDLPLEPELDLETLAVVAAVFAVAVAPFVASASVLAVGFCWPPQRTIPWPPLTMWWKPQICQFAGIEPWDLPNSWSLCNG